MDDSTPIVADPQNAAGPLVLNDMETPADAAGHDLLRLSRSRPRNSRSKHSNM